jgi:hypothetical protein
MNIFRQFKKFLKRFLKLNLAINGCLVITVFFLLFVVYTFVGKRAIPQTIDFSRFYIKLQASDEIALLLPEKKSSLNFQGVWPIHLRTKKMTFNKNINAVFVRVHQNGEEVFAQTFGLNPTTRYSNIFKTQIPRNIIEERLSTGEFIVDYGYIYNFFNGDAPWVVLGKVKVSSDFSSQQNGSLIKMLASIPTTTNPNGGILYTNPVNMILKYKGNPVYEFTVEKADSTFEYKFGEKINPEDLTIKVPGGINYQLHSVEIDEKIFAPETAFVKFDPNSSGNCKTNFPGTNYLECSGEYYLAYNKENPLPISNIAIDLQGYEYEFALYANTELLQSITVNRPQTVYYDYYGKLDTKQIKVGLSEYTNPQSDVLQIVIDGKVYTTAKNPEWRSKDYRVYTLTETVQSPISSPIFM